MVIQRLGNLSTVEAERGDFGDADQRLRAGPGPATRRCEVMDGGSGNRCAFTADPPSVAPFGREGQRVVAE